MKVTKAEAQMLLANRKNQNATTKKKKAQIQTQRRKFPTTLLVCMLVSGFLYLYYGGEPSNPPTPSNPSTTSAPSSSTSKIEDGGDAIVRFLDGVMERVTGEKEELRQADPISPPQSGGLPIVLGVIAFGSIILFMIFKGK